MLFDILSGSHEGAGEVARGEARSGFPRVESGQTVTSGWPGCLAYAPLRDCSLALIRFFDRRST